jgi:GR25 family glycosyltransferase involved in LPS biosynthesis
MTRGHLPVFYINVAARADRRAHMERQFATLGLSAERIEAKLPADIPDAVAEAAQSMEDGKRLSFPEIACTLSHFAAWQEAIDRGAAACLVLEDDAVLSTRLTKFLQALGSALPKGIDLLKIETREEPVRLGRKAIGMADVTLRRLASDHYGSCGYVISTGLAADIIATMPVASLPIDDYLFARNGSQLYTAAVYQLHPALARQLALRDTAGAAEAARSDIDVTRARRHGGNRRSLPRLRRLQWNLASAWREARAFGPDALNAKAPVPFADDAPGT